MPDDMTLDDMTMVGCDGIRRSFDEHFDTMMMVEQDPSGAHHAIHNQHARIEELEAQVRAADALAEWVEGIIEDGCPACGGDCSSANPPPGYCPQKEATNDLAAYRATKEGGA